MSTLVEIKGDLFNSPLLTRKGCMIVHCVSADYALGAGFALELEKKYHIRDYLKQIGSYNYPDCLVVGNIINMVTKGAYWTKPTYETFTASIIMVREYCLEHQVSILVMPKIGCGLDKLSWKVCKEIIQKELVDYNIDCAVYKLK